MNTLHGTVEYRMSDDYREHRDDPAFYKFDYTGHIWVATVKLESTDSDDETRTSEILIYCDGDMKAYYYEDPRDADAGIYPEIIRFTDHLRSVGIHNDDQLLIADDEQRLVWQNNAWFDLYGTVGKYDQWSVDEHLDRPCHSLREAVEVAKSLLETNAVWTEKENA